MEATHCCVRHAQGPFFGAPAAQNQERQMPNLQWCSASTRGQSSASTSPRSSRQWIPFGVGVEDSTAQPEDVLTRDGA
jgi:hypothetical protein